MGALIQENASNAPFASGGMGSIVFAGFSVRDLTRVAAPKTIS